MNWFYIPNHSTTQTEKLEGNPWDFESARPKLADKPAYRKWCKSEDTQHIFFTAFEGLNPGLRVEKENNPPLKQWAWVVDYDYRGKQEELIARIETELPADLLPTAVSSTFSGGARVVWVFEDFVWADQPEVSERFQRKLGELLKVSRLAPGFDDASYSTVITWELGQDWQVLGQGNKLSTQTLTKLQFECCRAVKSVKSGYTEIPWDVIQTKVEEMFPGRLGELTLGRDVRVPLFWIDDKNPDHSGICAEWGVYSFSTRADQGLTFWDDILGAEFMRQFSEKKIAGAVDNNFFDGKLYWQISGQEQFEFTTKDDLTQSLKVRGYSHRVDKKATSTEVDQIIEGIRSSNRVFAACPFPHTHDRFVDHNGNRYLNINHRKPMLPAGREECEDDKNFPWFSEFLEGYFDEALQDGCRPIDFWLADMQRTLRALHGGEPCSGKAEILAGGKNLGKSLMAIKVKRMLFGSGTDAGKFLLEQGAFNKELAQCFHWYVDDNQSVSSSQRHMLFSETLKKHVATPEVVYHPKFQDANVIPWYGRISITCNDDPDSLSIIPNMDMTIRDKVSLYKLNRREIKFPANSDLHKILERELPYFVGYMLHHYDPPIKVLDTVRFGIKPYHHVDLLQTAKEVTSHARLEEIVEIWRDLNKYDDNDSDDSPVWEGTSSALLAQMTVHEGLRGVLKTYSPTSFARALDKLQKDGSCPFMNVQMQGRKRLWKLEKLTA
jgi:hypothetical protein|tara:strand:- start:2314 stop:4479 length:2166 start_codon:yes stop_codon:yes gene_type:complete